jgi:hypothetical protein
MFAELADLGAKPLNLGLLVDRGRGPARRRGLAVGQRGLFGHGGLVSGRRALVAD